ncbi:MAG TPA: DUF4258 domain-containing protein [Burkholderiales bacterium]|nr:DUF4258 domain-containing protein [Burkholderiales bacterium]
MAGTPYELTAHASVVIVERGIDPEWIEHTLAEPDRTESDRNDPAHTHALRRIAACDDRVLRVVYNASVSPPKIVTAYFDQRQKGKP